MNCSLQSAHSAGLSTLRNGSHAANWVNRFTSNNWVHPRPWPAPPSQQLRPPVPQLLGRTMAISCYIIFHHSNSFKIIYIYIYNWVGNSTVPKNIKGFGYISSRCPFFLSFTCAIRLHQDFSRQEVANMKCKMVLVSTSYTMTRWIPDRCAHDLHSLSTFVSPES